MPIAAAALIALNRQRAQQQFLMAADLDRPKAHRAAQDLFLDRDKGKGRDVGYALAQAIGRLGEAAWPETFRIQGRDLG